ncbi:MAG TPA: M24 family metallopeptidase [Kofleriaceae bacterium]|nr:M24 family metallopeptidase [Kofleriaceae bacterium]
MLSRLSAAALALLVAAPAHAQSDDTPAKGRQLDVEAAQGILAVQRLDGWLLAQSGSQNPIAAELVAPAGAPMHPWYYFIPAQGEPVALTHKSDAVAFQGVPGAKLEYSDHRDLRTGLRAMLKGARRVAMEYAPRSGIASLTRVDAGTVDLVRAAGVKISSSAELVQFTKSLWGPDGRIAHYTAIHHLARIKDATLAHLAAQLRGKKRVTELDLQRFIQRGFQMRGLEGPPPQVAAGANTADPQYAPAAGRAAVIKRGDLLLLDFSARLTGAPRPIYARLAWVAYVGDAVPARFADVFRTVAAARDAAVKFVEERLARRRVVKGFEADQKARAVIAEAKLGDKFIHRTGHSLDTSLQGDGANLDDYQSRDTRNLVMGSGFTVGPGVYLRGDFGLRTIVDVYIGRKGLEVTSPAQQTITPVLAP